MLILFLLAAQIEPSTVGGMVFEDSIPADSIFQDSLHGGVSEVRFGADTLIFYTETRDVLLLHNAWVIYGETKVVSDSIRFSTKERILSAHKKARLYSANDSVVGLVMHYAVETQKGMMEEGRTKIEEGYFYGRGIWLVEEDVLHITNGYYTTCEKENPHYDFYGWQLKVLLDDMVISRPIFLRFRLFKKWRVPMLAAPFWYMPIGSDRKSGLLPFSVGHNLVEGYYAKDIRYYWVPNDYTDVTFILNIMTVKGFRPGLEFNWEYGPKSAQYLLGGFSGNYINEPYGTGQRKQRWVLKLSNVSKIPDGTQIKADINYQSDQTYIQDYSDDPDSIDDILETRTISNLSISRKLLGRPMSLSASHTYDFADSSWVMTMPSFNVSLPTLNPLNFFTLSFGQFRITNKYSHEWVLEDSLSTDSNYIPFDTRTTTFTQPLNLSWSYKFFGAYTYNQGFGANQRLEWTQDSLIRGANYSFSQGLSTQLYRLFGIYSLGMNGLLHTITPGITHSVIPNTDIIHPWLVYPRFDTTLSSHNLHFDVEQTFQTKFQNRNDTSRLRKQNLLTLATGLGYNLKTDSLTPVSASVDLPYGLPVTAGLKFEYNLYTDSISLSSYVTANIDEILFPLFGLRKRGERAFGNDTTPISDSLSWEEELWLDSLNITDTVTSNDSLVPDSLPSSKQEEEETFPERFSKSRLSITDNWTMNGDHMLSFNTLLYFPWDIELRMSAGTNLTEEKRSWKDYFANYNLALVKGLHCWEMVFELRPVRSSGSLELDSLDWSLYFRITELPEIELGKGMFEQFTGGGQ